VAERPNPSEPITRLLVEKRCEVYTRAAGTLMDLEEALDEDDGVRARYLLQDLRRCLRSSLAFLTDEVYQELQRIESLGETLPDERSAGHTSIPHAALDQLSDRLQLMHVKLARAVKMSQMQDMEQIVGLPQRLKQKLARESRDLDARARRREIEERCWQLEAEAREHLNHKAYNRAIKSLRKAIRLDPGRAVFHNDLGVVLSLIGRNSEAVGEYQAAVGLNEAHPAQRTDEWTTSYYNLGIALRKVALEGLRTGAFEVAMGRLQEAIQAFEEFTRVCASGTKVHDARALVDQLSSQIVSLGAQIGEAETA
jgi:tetratricopeptide (TPR) repeat protein